MNASAVASRLIPVAAHHLRTVHDDLAGLALRQFLQRDGIDDARVDVVERDAQALLLRAIGRVGVRGGHRLGHAVALAVLEVELLLHRQRHRLGHRGTAAADAPHARQVVFTQARVAHEVDHHRGDQRQPGDAIALHAQRRGVAIPARQQHDGGGVVDGAVQMRLHAGDVEHRQHREADAALVGAGPHAGGVEHHAAVRVHAALGVAGGARGVGHHREVVGAAVDGARCRLRGQHVGPCHESAR